MSEHEQVYTQGGGGLPSELLQAAQTHAQRGWRVFPVSDASPEKPHRSRAKHPTEPLQRARGPLARLPQPWGDLATDDVNRVLEWWENWPTANIGVATGVKSGLLALHVDADDAAIRDYLAKLPPTVTAHADGVTDYYFRMPTTDEPIHDQTGRLPAGIHVRGEKQYVVAPPSWESLGHQYSWLSAPDEVPLASLPEDVLNDILRRGAVTLNAAEAARVEQAKLDYLPAALEQVASGTRPWEAGNQLARALSRAGLDRVREATPVMDTFVEQAQRMTPQDGITQSDGDNLLKQAYRGILPVQM